MSRYVAQAAGATLGFIGGEVSGAIAGWETAGDLYDWSRGKSLPQNMQTPSTNRTNKRTRSRSVSRGRTMSRSVRRKLSYSSTRSRSRRSSRRSYSRPVIKGGQVKVNQRDPEVFVSSKAKNKKKRIMRVSKKFKKMVKQVTKGYQPKGSFQAIHYGIMNVSAKDKFVFTSLNPYGIGYQGAPILTGVTSRQFLYGQTTPSNVCDFNAFHLWEMIFHHACTWFNLPRRLLLHAPNDPLTLDPIGFQEFLDSYNGHVNNSVLDTTNVFQKVANVMNSLIQSPIEVITAYRTYTLRNNSGRTMIVTFYDGVPKVPIVPGRTLYSDWLYNYNSKLGKGNPEDKRQFINQGLDAAYPELTEFFNGGTVSGGATQLASPQSLMQTPYMYPELLKSWKIGKKRIILEPGQVYVHTVQGPKNYTITPRHYFRGGLTYVPNSNTPLTVQDGYDFSNMFAMKPGVGVSTIISVVPDMAILDDVAAVMPLNDTTEIDNKYGIALKLTKYISTRMPDQQGFTQTYNLPLPQTGVSGSVVMDQNLNRRKPQMFRVMWDSLGNNAAINEALADRIDPLNPTVNVVDT